MSNGMHPVLRRPLAGLYTLGGASSRRESSWDRSGANRDWTTVPAGETVTLLDARGPGCITHFYCATILAELTDYRDAILRCYWEGAPNASVEVPLGDFFGLPFCRVRELTSGFVAVNPGFGGSYGHNAYFPMPFAERALITLENRGAAALGGYLEALWYHIDYELYDEPLPPDVGRFHARYAQELLTTPVGDEPNVTLHDAANLDGVENYVAVDTAGSGRMVGLVLEIDNQAGGWYGEGDDMVFVDGNGWPPAVHGTGTEEIFGGGACPTDEYAGPYTGFHLIESRDYGGVTGMYRWLLQDPISFRESLRWTVEHGHANNFANTYASVAYWYQDPIVAAAPDLPGRIELLPRFGDGYEEARELLRRAAAKARAGGATALPRLGLVARPYYEGRWLEAIAALREYVERER